MSFLFVLLIILLGIAIVMTIAFPYLYRVIYRKFFHRIYGQKIYHIAMRDDYYFISKLVLENHHNSRLTVDQLLFGNKYIYVFYDFYCDDDLYGKSTDNSLLIKSKKGHSYIDNPLNIAQRNLKDLASIINIDESLFIPIALVNDSCTLMSGEENTSIVHLRKLKKVIKEYESRDVAPLNQEQMVFAVKDIATLNLRDVKR